jgi:hypothetical protein
MLPILGKILFKGDPRFPKLSTTTDTLRQHGW